MQALGVIGDARALPALESILYDPLPESEEQKDNASEAIRKIKENITQVGNSHPRVYFWMISKAVRKRLEIV